jgi:hypothetical protein
VPPPLEIGSGASIPPAGRSRFCGRDCSGHAVADTRF